MMGRREELLAMVAEATPGPWEACGEPWNRTIYSSAENRVCFMAHTNGLDDARDIATSELVAQAPTIATELAAALAEVEALRAVQAAYDELLATVRGECPSLVNEDSGGSDVLINLMIKAEDALADLHAAALAEVEALRGAVGLNLDAALDAMEANMRADGQTTLNWREDLPPEDQDKLRACVHAGFIAALTPQEPPHAPDQAEG